MEEIKKTIKVVIYGGILVAVFCGAHALLQKYTPNLCEAVSWILGVILLYLLGTGIKKIK